MRHIVAYCSILFMLSGCIKKPLVTVEPSLLKAQNDVNALKGEIKEFKGDVSGIKELQAELTAKINSTIEAITGVNNKVNKMSAGRDMIQTTTNDTDLMKYIIKGLVGLCSTLLTILFFVIKALFKMNTEKKFFKEKTLLNIQSDDELKSLKMEEEAFVKTKGHRRVRK